MIAVATSEKLREADVLNRRLESKLVPAGLTSYSGYALDQLIQAAYRLLTAAGSGTLGYTPSKRMNATKVIIGTASIKRASRYSRNGSGIGPNVMFSTPRST